MKRIILAGMLAFATMVPATVAFAQSADDQMRIQQLEEQVRQLNGRIEDMSYQLLQMQEQLRKTQEDNEFRFQELEGGKKSGGLEKPADATQDTASGDQTPGATSDEAANLDPLADSTQGNDGALGKPAITLGEIRLDQNGNVIGSEAANNDAVSTDLPPPDTSTTDKQASSAGSEDQDYQAAYEQVLAGDYTGAENGFLNYVGKYPSGRKIADANFWLGEAQYSQGKFTEAAKTFLNAYKTYGNSEKAPEMLLKLAMSLGELDSKDTACATLRQVTKSYPKASRAIISKVASEEKRLAC